MKVDSPLPRQYVGAQHFPNSGNPRIFNSRRHKKVRRRLYFVDIDSKHIATSKAPLQAVTTGNVIVDNTDGLHVRVGGGGANEPEAALLERLRESL